MRINDKPMHLNIMRYQRMIDYCFHRLTNRLLRITESV